ncbi:ester cyclase [Pseudomonas sp. O64]|uniref:ester cyclase n=1 Tax=Pseudomonas TaxID=286 RepID=UPI000B9FFEEB|nr:MULTISPECIES: ester cyclase [unclassified Pseudomonas]MCV2229119.1 ester cyclase [Pseudomonas sp. AU10]OZO04349.1 hypothetical protein B7453_11370 [Pseudomonas sp. IB20]UNM17748.1 ester cyclase [Pseudomonas sp. ArH3a]UXZ20543.1 ester cyclase [Pseudomonas sp. YeP6b]
MTDQQRNLINEWAESWSTPSKERFLAIFSETTVYEDKAARQIMRGRNELGDFFDQIRKALPDFKVISDLISLGERGGTIQWHMTGTQKGELFGYGATYNQINVDGTCVIRIQDNKIVECTDYYDMKTLYRQLGFDNN